MIKADSLEKVLILVKMEGRRKKGQKRIRWLDDITDLTVKDEEAWNAAVNGVAKSWTRLSD